MAFQDTDQIIKVRRNDKLQSFDSLRSGVTFSRPNFRHPDDIWIKIDKNFAQTLDDDNSRRRIDSHELVYQVLLVIPDAPETPTSSDSAI